MITTKRVKSFGVFQTAKVMAIIYFFLIAIFMIPFGLIMNATGAPTAFPGGTIFFFIAPFLYAALIFVFSAIGCLIYNLISKWTGGIEVEIETTSGASGDLIDQKL